MKHPLAFGGPVTTTPAILSLRRIISLATLLMAVLWLSACSAVKLSYNALPEVTYWWADAYGDFNGEQSLRLKQDLADLQAWHRTRELPRYRELLLNLERLTSTEPDAAQLCSLLPPARERLQALAEQSAPMIARLALSLSPAQLEHTAKKFAKNEAKLRSEWVELSPGELLDKRIEQYTDRAESLYGRLSAPQRQGLREALQASAFDPRIRLAEQQRRHQDMLDTLRRLRSAGANQAQAEQAWLAYLARALSPPVPAHREQQEHSVEEGCRIYAQLQRQATPEQRDKAAKRLRGWSNDVQALSQQP
jgi:hypothetical protein